MSADRQSIHAGIVQFGTGRFLLAHVDTLVSESLAAGDSEDRILVVQSSSRAEGKRKARLLAERRHYPVRIRGYRGGETVDIEQTVTSVADCVIAEEQWPALERHFVEQARIVVSNTADSGFDVGNDSSLAAIPTSFPGKLTRLLRARFEAGNDGLTVLPCELIEHNGQQLKSLVSGLARRDGAGQRDNDAFLDWLETRCVWADTLVDRIVSAPLEPIGAIAEPYALWAIARQPDMAVPCVHADVELVDDLTPQALCKLHILNLAHTFLVHRWRQAGQSTEFVREAMATPSMIEPLRQLLDDEVIPTLASRLPRERLTRYRDITLERFANPFLDHRLADIAQNHDAKLIRRVQPVVEMARKLELETPRLDEVLATQGG
ncbi:mannitol dehydrogenase [Salinicola rhizosphaerae]|uniref:D-mannonate oxidoreductase n=1 Tax=Salinicola rhizosphaerae TaxID=1443141 RepID=A0ABQ3E8R4_9GAMM|nr:mannitol dehydrogenase [Salinicola rhizosphaerae]GHB28554.1 D-mannonate oxidoreductase [Salinicola rhizosphaerae]